MKYTKHMTLKEWNRFNKILKDSDSNFIPPGSEFHFTGYDNLEQRYELSKKLTAFSDPEEYDKVNEKFPPSTKSMTSITTQEVLLSKYKIVLDGFEPKWKRRYHAFTKVVNMKNFDKGMKTFDKSMQAFSKGVGQVEKDIKQNKKNQEILWGKKPKSKSKKAPKEKSVDEIFSKLNFEFKKTEEISEEENKKLAPLRDKKMESAATLQKLNLDISNLIEEEGRVKSLQDKLEKSIKTLESDLEREKSISLDADLNEKRISKEKEDLLNTENKLLDVEVGFSFFPQDGIFNQLISTGAFELIKNVELKNILLEMYNHQKDRNYATSTEIDQFNLGFRNIILKEFRISFNYNSFDGAFYGSRTLNKYKFNKTYYMSNSFYGLLSQANLYGNMYTRQLKDIEKSYLTALSLTKNELEN